MEPNEANVTSVAEWKKQAAGEPFIVPSGNTCLVRRRGVRGFLRNGNIPNLLLPILQRAMERASKDEDITPEEIMDDFDLSDPELVVSMLQMVDAVAVECVAEPKLQAVPICGKCHGAGSLNQKPCAQCKGAREFPARDPELLYVDEIASEDKMAVFAFAIAEVDDIVPFRVEPPKKKAVGARGNGKSVARKAKQPVRSRR